MMSSVAGGSGLSGSSPAMAARLERTRSTQSSVQNGPRKLLNVYTGARSKCTLASVAVDCGSACSLLEGWRLAIKGLK